ncbi:MAG: hypothetical protein Q4P66_04995 [Actinomycetaceae bacterium]|nr:hypothetical protein [Actinomycetaceae bacterium]MDO5746998.1 hypothetical protein [Actinomycetaceae bacterium]
MGKSFILRTIAIIFSLMAISIPASAGIIAGESPVYHGAHIRSEDPPKISGQIYDPHNNLADKKEELTKLLQEAKEKGVHVYLALPDSYGSAEAPVTAQEWNQKALTASGAPAESYMVSIISGPTYSYFASPNSQASLSLDQVRELARKHLVPNLADDKIGEATIAFTQALLEETGANSIFSALPLWAWVILAIGLLCMLAVMFYAISVHRQASGKSSKDNESKPRALPDKDIIARERQQAEEDYRQAQEQLLAQQFTDSYEPSPLAYDNQGDHAQNSTIDVDNTDDPSVLEQTAANHTPQKVDEDVLTPRQQRQRERARKKAERKRLKEEALERRRQERHEREEAKRRAKEEKSAQKKGLEGKPGTAGTEGDATSVDRMTVDLSPAHTHVDTPSVLNDSLKVTHEQEPAADIPVIEPVAEPHGVNKTLDTVDHDTQIAPVGIEDSSVSADQETETQEMRLEDMRAYVAQTSEEDSTEAGPDLEEPSVSAAPEIANNAENLYQLRLSEKQEQEQRVREQREREEAERRARQEAERREQKREEESRLRLEAERKAQEEAQRAAYERERQEIAVRQQAEQEAQAHLARQQAKREALARGREQQDAAHRAHQAKRFATADNKPLSAPASPARAPQNQDTQTAQPSPLTQFTRRLREADDMIRQSRKDLEIAQGRFGKAHTAPFAAAIVEAHNAVRAGFDEFAQAQLESRPAQVGTVFDTIDAPLKQLRSQVEQFVKMRHEQTSVSDISADLRPRFNSAQRILKQARGIIARLSISTSPDQLHLITADVTHGENLLKAAEQKLTQAEQADEAHQDDKVTTLTRQAERCILEATAAAQRLGDYDAYVRAQQVRLASPQGDDLDSVRARLEKTLEAVILYMATVDDFIDIRTGQIGVAARTMLVQANNTLSRADDIYDSDPVQALHYVEQAEQLSIQAQRLASQDVERRNKK